MKLQKQWSATVTITITITIHHSIVTVRFGGTVSLTNHNYNEEKCATITDNRLFLNFCLHYKKIPFTLFHSLYSIAWPFMTMTIRIEQFPILYKFGCNSKVWFHFRIRHWRFRSLRLFGSIYILTSHTGTAHIWHSRLYMDCLKIT